MSNQNQPPATENNETVDAREFTGTKLQLCLQSIYDCTRTSTELDALKNKLQSLSSIRQALSNDANRPVAALETMNNTINELEADIEKKTQNIKNSEIAVIEGFQDIVSKVMSETDEKVTKVSEGIRRALEKFGKSITDQFNNKLSETEKGIELLKTEKLSVSEKEAITKIIDDFKSSVIETQRKTFSNITTQMTAQFQSASEKNDKLMKQFDIANVTHSVQAKVLESMDKKLKENLDQLKKENTQLIEKHQQSNITLSSKFAELITKQVHEQTNPDKLQKIISSLPEFQALLTMQESLKNNPQGPALNANELADFASLRESVSRLSKELNELKHRSSSTRAIVDVLKDAGVSRTESAKIDVDYKAAVKHMEEMEREVSLIYNNIKIMETVVSVKSKAVEEATGSKESTEIVSRKRPRLEGPDEEMVDQTALLARLAELENKHQKLLDFILQCKDTVLDDMFPTRLQATMKKIEQVLVNHETFIAYLIDPFTTTQRTRSTNFTLPEDTSSVNALHPSMLDAITQLVKKTAQEVSAPLRKKIKVLEDKLERQQQQ
ncbi:uncharacterized protein B0P05DRAFT_584957 [Gilbertella persicaria]|uniref:uncharacterized protein n=1 Tax=Gilbertella persicaria TaxID=101096 RepID=UPI00221F02AE|nr:uncharacterized protein B0P05DRAFT_584957 [Gilbertella persicaria]KAI8087738.1 hypothetical protein B0P05DRAFT_584957 [Gilbertella persicaria]